MKMKNQNYLLSKKWKDDLKNGIIGISGYIQEYGNIFFTIQRTDNYRSLAFHKEGITLFEDKNGFTKVIGVIESEFRTIISNGWSIWNEMEYIGIQEMLADRILNEKLFESEDFTSYWRFFSLHFARVVQDVTIDGPVPRLDLLFKD